jgi:DnaJ-class molecular chaperone
MGKVNALFQDAIEKLSEICPECDGDGLVVVEIYRPQSFDRDVGFIDCEDPRPCERCAGEGVIFKEEDDDEY